MNLTLRPVAEADLEALSALCLRSKAWWGYDAAFMALCVDALTLGPEALTPGASIAAWDGSAPAGVACVSVEGCVAELEKLFVDPPYIGTGLGRRLFDWATEAARAGGANALRILADPGAAPFYERMGAKLVGDEPSDAIPGRMLPRLVVTL